MKANLSVLYFLFLFTGSALLFSSCAQVVAPSGGKIDVTPPHVRHYKPDSASVNFKSSRILIEFDEYIVLKDQSSQILISPPLEKQPDIHINGKSVVIDLKGPLKDSTTYTINFGSAIQDNHEARPLQNFKYVFSTGRYVDSIGLNGSVINALTRQPEKGVLVMLYDNLKDSVSFLQVPSYFGKTNENGDYHISNIKPAVYKVIALVDGNGNYKLNTGEIRGFRTENLSLFKNDTANLSVFKEEPGNQKLKKSFQEGYRKIRLWYNKPVSKFVARPLNLKIPGGEEFVEKNDSGDSLTYWFNIPETDSLLLRVEDEGYHIADTLRFKLVSRTKLLSQNKGKKPVLNIITNARHEKPFDLGSKLEFEFSNPVLNLEPAPGKVMLFEDTMKKNFFIYDKLSWKNKNNSLRFRSWSDSLHPFKESRRYHLLVLPGAYTDIFGFTNDTLKTDFKTEDSRFYGTLKLHLHIAKGKYILQLLNEAGNIVRSTDAIGDNDMDFEYLPPAKYQARLIFDANGNGKWDTGNYLKHLQPERVVYDAQIIVIRSNWDQELDWFVK